MNVFIDLETIPEQPEAEAKAAIAESIQAPASMKKPETVADWHNGVGKYAGEKEALIEERYRKTALDGSKGEIISIAFAVEGGEVFVSSRQHFESEVGLIENALYQLDQELSSYGQSRPPYFVGHNIGGFDLKFLYQRCVINRINPGFDLKQWGRHGSQFFDTMQAWAGWGNRISQDNLCKALGIEGKPDDIDGSKVWDFYKAGQIGRIAEYNADDVLKVREIYQRLTFATQAAA
ncbi:ribonuclease H-like domain-containing protein [Gilvimarinus chinensis]|uniref:ribonuclease H-like domain-containing protein n=1 Tax=Gilvimarinus chinensis TaxID=396005 RepID=UPI000379FC74|nr:ribonuclease H-like domain-containing protein [Gilvimarinus chinensis]